MTYVLINIIHLQVYVYDKDTSGGGICGSYSDPHMQTFDGRYWGNQRVGEFVMYRHKTKPLSVSQILDQIPDKRCTKYLFDSSNQIIVVRNM